MNLTKSNEMWCIEDTLFYPLGLINHNTGNKTVFVTWNDKFLMNFIFNKDSGNFNSFKKFTISVPDKVQDIIILEINTLVLLVSGEVCYFSSIKSIHRIPWLSKGVQCITRSMAGFSLVRVLENNKIQLELYNDVPNVGKCPQECVKTFDLTFDDKNLFCSDWSDHRITLTSVQISNENRKFVELLLKEVNLQTIEVYLFSVSNNLFAIYIKEQDNYEIKTLAPQVSGIELIKFLEESNMLLVFLDCGIIEIWYVSKIALVIEKKIYFNGGQFVHHAFSGSVLFFTDEQKVSRLTFCYDPVEHTCQVEEKSIDAIGMVAVTYVEVSGNLVCLSNNNIFYQISFEGEKEMKEVHDDIQAFELTTQKVQDMLGKTLHLNQIALLPKKIDKLIEDEYKKQELISICEKNFIYSDLVSPVVSFSQHIPCSAESLYYTIDRGLPPFSYFAVISLKILSHDIFKSTNWKIMITHSSNIRIMSVTQNVLQEKFNLLLPIKKSDHELISKIEIQLLTQLSVDQNFVCINIPIKVQEMDVINSFSPHRGLKESKINLNPKKNIFSFKLCNSKLHMNNVCKAFGLPVHKGSKHFEDDIHIQKIYFLGAEIDVFFNETTRTVHLESLNAVAIYYAKICLLNYLWSNVKQSTDNYVELRQILLELQCKIENNYGSLTKGEQHFSNLKTIYSKLRNDIVWTF